MKKILKLILDQIKKWGFVLKWFSTLKIFYETFVLKKISLKTKYNFKTRNKIFLFDDVKPAFFIHFKSSPTFFECNYYLYENQIDKQLTFPLQTLSLNEMFSLS